ncbi:rhodanese-like domain-containing protein [Candidatus Sororendozoicomonas aggregata]|uniref:rhodanese-like domain-containing protein n=1 Tax=Candidatus Sororendozoicomonas aggregata TaxID=3073239 RepID=UPI002ED1A517
MEQLFEFAANHLPLVAALVAILCALFLTEMRKGGQALSTQEMIQLVNQEDAIVIDVRKKADYDKGHIVNAINIPYANLKNRISELNKHKNKPIIIVDAMGQHASSAIKTLKESGLTNVVKLKGGVGTWQADSLPLIK